MAKGTPVTVQFTGNETVEEIMRELPNEVRSTVMQKVFAKASQPFVRDARGRFTGREKKGVGTINGKVNGNFYAGLVRKGSNGLEYMIAYWKNFGTLANRDKSWSFSYARKRKSASWRGGIKPRGNIAGAWEANKARVEATIENESAKIIMDYLKKRCKR
jgi:hypothetical protein